MLCHSSITRHSPRGFSLIELVIVVVIIGVIGAIAMPRISRGADGADESKLRQDLAVLNKAVDFYAAEHNGQYPTAADAKAQLTQFTDSNGNVSPRKTGNFIYGPYLREAPPAPSGPRRGDHRIGLADAPGIGWLYSPAKGRIYLNRGLPLDDSDEDEALSR